jgi:hypothetical protein
MHLRPLQHRVRAVAPAGTSSLTRSSAVECGSAQHDARLVPRQRQRAVLDRRGN